MSDAMMSCQEVQVSFAGAGWSIPDTVLLAEEQDPIRSMIERATESVERAIAAGWFGPPFDPFVLARHLELEVRPCHDVFDASVAPSATGKRCIEYNPNRPRARIYDAFTYRMAQVFVADSSSAQGCATTARNGGDAKREFLALCQIVAAQFRLPVGSVPQLRESQLELDQLLALRERLDVDVESLLLRVAELADASCAVFGASRLEEAPGPSVYQLDYLIGSRTWCRPLTHHLRPPVPSLVSTCTAIGCTAAGQENWLSEGEAFCVECIAVPPYPGLISRVSHPTRRSWESYAGCA